MPNETIEEVKKIMNGLPLQRKMDIMKFIDTYYMSRAYIATYQEEYEAMTDEGDSAIETFVRRLNADDPKVS